MSREDTYIERLEAQLAEARARKEARAAKRQQTQLPALLERRERMYENLKKVHAAIEERQQRANKIVEGLKKLESDIRSIDPDAIEPDPVDTVEE